MTLVERAKLGGTCLHTGCIPTKTLRSSADVLEMSGRLAEFGITGECALKADMPAIVNRKRKVTATLQTGLEKTCAQLKVRVVYGKAELVGAKLVRVTPAEGTEEVESDNVIIATGSSPLEWPALPVDHARVLDVYKRQVRVPRRPCASLGPRRRAGLSRRGSRAGAPSPPCPCGRRDACPPVRRTSGRWRCV